MSRSPVPWCGRAFDIPASFAPPARMAVLSADCARAPRGGRSEAPAARGRLPSAHPRGAGWLGAGWEALTAPWRCHTHAPIPHTSDPLSTVTRGSGSGRAQCGTGHRGAHRGAGTGTRGGHKKPLGLSVLRWFTFQRAWSCLYIVLVLGHTQRRRCQVGTWG
jgi:hypothetical protein